MFFDPVMAASRAVADPTRKLLIVEDDPGIQSQLRWCFGDYEVIAATDRTQAINEVRRHEPGVVLQDLGLPPDDEGVTEGFATLRDILTLAPFTKIIVVTGHGDQSNALKAVGLGAYDFYQKPLDVDTLQLIVQRAYQIHALEAENRRARCRARLSAARRRDRLERVDDEGLPNDREGRADECDALLLGESGTGKELFARAIHALSHAGQQGIRRDQLRRDPGDAARSELFGFEKGAFTGAVKQTQGKFELADGGTLFLDEIGDMPLRCRRSCCASCRTASSSESAAARRFRSTCASSARRTRTCRQRWPSGEFREDLYYRISEVTVPFRRCASVPGDAIVIARHLLNSRDASSGARSGFTRDAQDAIEGYAGPVTSANSRTGQGRVIMAEGKFVTAARPRFGRSPSPPSLNLRLVRQHAETSGHSPSADSRVGQHLAHRLLLGVTRPDALRPDGEIRHPRRHLGAAGARAAQRVTKVDCLRGALSRSAPGPNRRAFWQVRRPSIRRSSHRGARARYGFESGAKRYRFGRTLRLVFTARAMR